MKLAQRGVHTQPLGRSCKTRYPRGWGLKRGAVTMKPSTIFVPVLLQVGLTLFMYIRLVVLKTRASKAGQVNEARRALYDDAWPEPVIQVNNNIRNQFETPVLFYVLVGCLWSLQAADAYAITTAGVYALSRWLHAYVHTGSNVVPVRRRVFTFGVAMLVVLAGLCVRAVLREIL